jgi:predicted helicase
MVERLGIVYTPVEVVDFIIQSVNDVLKNEFNRNLGDENIHILDPFTGTGTFITRLLQSGLIDRKDLKRKYELELHANEIVLLAYYIAAVNIEHAYHDFVGESIYQPFNGICLTDTFQLGESEESDKLFSEMFTQNSKMVAKQKQAPVMVIIGNPPYSVGQKSANDNAQNQKYELLDSRVELTYAKGSKATSVKALYDSYIKAFRWSTDRLGKDGGIICFVSNGAWIDGNGMDGFRRSLESEFSSIYVFNLRGNQRTSGELSRKEGGKIFGSGSRTPIAITLLVKNPTEPVQKARIHYFDIGEYQSREEKLAIVKNFKSVASENMQWRILVPNEHSDWISQRNDVFSTFIQLETEKKFDTTTRGFFTTYSLGIATARDAWVYNSSSHHLSQNMNSTIAFFNEQRRDFAANRKENPKLKFDSFASKDATRISWNDSLKILCAKNTELKFNESALRTGTYRPFFKTNLYFDKNFIQRPYQQPKLFPTSEFKNLIIAISGVGAQKDFAILVIDRITDLQVIDKCQCFPLYYYEERQKLNRSLFDEDGESEYIRRDGVSDFILVRAKKQYGKNVTKEDIFYYVYGFLHSPDYKLKFENDLKKMLPRIPLLEDVRDFWAFSKAGHKLVELHLNYESVPPYSSVKITGDDSGFYTVEKMRFPKKDQKDTIYYNSRITISNIPVKAYEYIVNGKSAIDWIMERYQVTINKDSGIKNDPNDWAKDVGNPRYILDLLLRIINVSVQTVDIVNGLPKLSFE